MNDFMSGVIGFLLGFLLAVVLLSFNREVNDVVASCQKHGLYATNNTIIKCEAMVLHK